MRLQTQLCVAAALIVGLALGACGGGGESPTTPGAVGDYVLTPPPGPLTVDALDTLRISVRTREGAPAPAEFYVDGVLDSTGSEFLWRAVKLGSVEITARLSPPTPPLEVSWAVTVVDPNPNGPIGVTQLQAGKGEVPGSIGLSWERPDAGKDEIDHYVVYLADHPISEGNAAQADSVVFAHDPRVVLQSHLLTGLVERQTYHLRVRLVDILGRRAPLSPEVVSLSTGHYRISGRVVRLRDPGGGVEGFKDVLVALGNYMVLTESDGSYVLDGIPDILEDRLLIKPSVLPDVNEFYWLRADTMETIDQTFDAILFRLGAVYVDAPRDSFYTRLDFLYTLAAKPQGTSIPPLIEKWEQYPIPVQVDPFVTDPGGADVGAALLEAISTWNTAAGEELLTPVLGPLDYGAEYLITNDPPLGGGLLGEVTMVDPPDSRCLFRCIPRKVAIHVSNQNTPEVMRLVAVHELGHVLWMTHSPNTEHVMSNGILQSSATIPNPDEVRVARLLKYIPNGTNLAWYIEPEIQQ